jgi:hypothetical protein
MKKYKQLSFGFLKQKKDTPRLKKLLACCQQLSGLLLMAQVVVSLGRIWILNS